MLIDSTHMKVRRCAGGGKGGGALNQAIGVSRGRRNNKLHTITDDQGRPLRFLLTGANVADCEAAEPLLCSPAPGALVLAGKAYESDAVRLLIESQEGGSEHSFQSQPPMVKPPL